ncbi:MAG: hypothetical protein ACI9WU_001260 [Myxococcota bacterium]|jgi:hypothetical protein
MWLDYTIKREVTDVASALAERLGMEATVGSVSLELDGTLLIRDLHLQDPNGGGLKLAEARVVVDVRKAFASPLDAISSVHLNRVVWREPGDPSTHEIARHLRALAGRLKRHTGPVRVGTRIPNMALPAVVIRDLRVVTEARTVLSARGEATPANGGLDWTAIGALDTGRGSSVGFRANGRAERGHLAGRVHVALDRGVQLEGPRGTRVAGVHRISWDGENARTGPAVVTDSSGQLRLAVSSVRLTPGPDGLPEVAHFDGATLRVRDRPVEVGDLRFDLRRRVVVVEDVAVRDADRTIRVDRLEVDLRSGAMDARNVVAELRSDVRSVLVRAARVRSSGPVGALPSHVEAQGVTFVAPEVQGELTRLTADSRDDGGWTLSGRGAVQRSGSDLSARVRGVLLVDASGAPTRATATIEDAPLAWDPSGVAERLSIPVTSRAQIGIEARLVDGLLTASGTARINRLAIGHWRFSPAPWEAGEVSLTFDARIDAATETVDVALDNITLGDATAALSVTVQGFGPNPHIRARLQLPEQDCQALVEAFPPAVRPNLPDLRLRGRTRLDARLTVDLADTSTLKLQLDGTPEDCHIVTLGVDVDRRVRRLGRKFVHRPAVAGVPVGVRVGPGTRQYVRLDQIPDWVEAAALATEDRRFYAHDGLRLHMIRGALKLNLRHRRYVYGGSTITQQLVKNLFLTRRKDLMRKLEEAVITTAIERKLSKSRILELYLNCIEYGPGIWGLASAAEAYYGKGVSEMTHVEGIYLMAIKPYPRHGWFNARRKKWGRNWVRRMAYIFHRTVKMGALTQDEYDAASPTFQPTFKIGTSSAVTTGQSGKRRCGTPLLTIRYWREQSWLSASTPTRPAWAPSATSANPRDA